MLILSAMHLNERYFDTVDEKAHFKLVRQVGQSVP